MNTKLKKPEPLTKDQLSDLENNINLSLDQFLRMIGPNVELIENVLHYGFGQDEDSGEYRQSVRKTLLAYGLLNHAGNTNGWNPPNEYRYQKVFIWKGNALWSADTVRGALEIAEAVFLQDDHYDYTEYEEDFNKQLPPEASQQANTKEAKKHGKKSTKAA